MGLFDVPSWLNSAYANFGVVNATKLVRVFLSTFSGGTRCPFLGMLIFIIVRTETAMFSL